MVKICIGINTAKQKTSVKCRKCLEWVKRLKIKKIYFIQDLLTGKN